MEAKDTVITGSVKQDLTIRWSNTISGHVLGYAPTLEPDAQEKLDNWIREIRLEQAEVSFKAGQKEVVDWVKETNHEPISSGVVSPEWQGKLKSWNISA